jgi:multidrug transporter EmrE-like cation transporter
MSLRSFHIVFITVCTLFCAFLVVWSFVLAPEPSAMATAYGIVGIVGILLMPAYAVCFLKKAAKLNL